MGEKSASGRDQGKKKADRSLVGTKGANTRQPEQYYKGQ